jgi:hypothetical protein
MGQIVNAGGLIGLGSRGVTDFQSIRDDNGVDPEYHAFMNLGRQDGEQAIYMIVKIDDPSGESVLTYHFNYNSEKAGAVEFETAWTGRAGLTYVRYDKVLATFFT